MKEDLLPFRLTDSFVQENCFGADKNDMRSTTLKDSDVEYTSGQLRERKRPSSHSLNVVN